MVGWEANFVNEQQVIDELENASDYERGLGRMDKKKKGIVQLEAILASFGCQIKLEESCSLIDTSIANYFACM